MVGRESIGDRGGDIDEQLQEDLEGSKGVHVVGRESIGDLDIGGRIGVSS